MRNVHISRWHLFAAAAFCMVATISWGVPPSIIASQEPQAMVRIVAQVATIDKSAGDVNVDVSAENVENLGGFQFVLSFNEDVLAFQDFAKGPFLGSTSREVVCNDPVLQRGTVRLSCVTLRDAPAGPNGSGTIATLRFTPASSGTSPLVLSSTKLAHPDGSIIESATQGSEIVVTGDNGSRVRTIVRIGGVVVIVAAVLVIAYVWLKRRRASPTSSRG